jgi:hypothetical protein
MKFKAGGLAQERIPGTGNEEQRRTYAKGKVVE